MAIVATACTRVSDGRPVAQPSGSARPLPSSTIIAAPSAPDVDPPGVQPTQRTPIAANSVTCVPPTKPPVSVAATIADPAAPRVTVGVPNGWSFIQGADDVAVTMQGPQGMSATVTIAPTRLEPSAAFREYTDDLMAKSAISTVSILPDELCDYSGQKLTGTWADDPAETTEFHDRVAHVWTNTGDFLIGIHVEGSAGLDGFDTASTTITDSVEVTIP